MSKQWSALVVAVAVLAIVALSCTKELQHPRSAGIAGPAALGKPKVDPPARTGPAWGMWSVEGGLLVGDNPSYVEIDALVDAGITYMCLDGSSALHDIWQINSQMITRALARGMERVVAPISHGMLQDAVSAGNIDDIKPYIYNVDTDFFCLDEPRHNGYPAWVVLDIEAYLDGLPPEVKGEERGIYIAAPIGLLGYQYDASYYGTPYRIMPDGYSLTLAEKRDVYCDVGTECPMAPIVGLMYVAGSGVDEPEYIHLKGDISSAYPYCEEVWFYTSVDHPPTGYDLFDPAYQRMEQLHDVIASYPDVGWGNWEWEHYTYGGSGAHPVPADYNGDGRTDLSVKCDDHRWLINYSDGGNHEGLDNGWDYESDECGGPTAHPCPADYDGDGYVDMSVKCDDGRWLIMYYAAGEFHTGWNWESEPWVFGGADAHPVPADYDGDGYADLSVKCDDGSWRINYASDGFDDPWDWEGTGFGDASAVPCPADYDGDGRADVSVKGPDGVWRINWAYDGFDGGWQRYVFGCGDETAHPAPADYDGDGTTDVAVKRDDGSWYVNYSSDGFGSGWNWSGTGFGGSGCHAVPADYDGDGIVDLAIKCDDGTWAINYVEPEFASRL